MGEVQRLGPYDWDIQVQSVPAQITVTEAPDKARVSLDLLMSGPHEGIRFEWPDRLLMGQPIQVAYRIVGFENGTLLVELDETFDAAAPRLLRRPVELPDDDGGEPSMTEKGGTE